MEITNKLKNNPFIGEIRVSCLNGDEHLSRLLPFIEEEKRRLQFSVRKVPARDYTY